MTRPNLIVVFSLSLVCFLGSIKILYAQTIIRGATLRGVQIMTDPCAGMTNANIGNTCTNGAIFAGTGYSSGGLNPALRYMVTPGGCTSETCAGAGGTDSITKAWANDSGTTAYGVNTGATDNNNGKGNTAILVNYTPYYTDTDAAHWCAGMKYGGYTNWYLPSLDELNYVLYVNKAALGGFAASIYWSSTENRANFAWIQNFANGIQTASATKTFLYYVRCARSY